MPASSRIVDDFERGFRALTRHPRFSLFAVLLLSLGIGMSTALFSLMYGVLLKPLPFPQQDRLVVAWKGDSKDPGYIPELSCPEFRDWQVRSHAVVKLDSIPSTVYGDSASLPESRAPLPPQRRTLPSHF